MVADDNGAGACLLGLQRSPDGHDALDEKGNAGHLSDLTQLLYRLAAGGGIHIFQEGQARRINVHGDGKAAGILAIAQLFLNGFQVPGLHGGNAHAAGRADGLAGHLHHPGVHAVAGESGNAVFGAGLDQNVIVGQVVIFVAVVHGDGPHGTGEEGVTEVLAKQLQRGVRGAAGADGIHIYADLLPLGVVAHGSVAHTLGAGAGDVVAAGLAVADGTGLAVGAQAFSGIRQNFLVGHMVIPPIW